MYPYILLEYFFSWPVRELCHSIYGSYVLPTYGATAPNRALASSFEVS
jgi:hypothetical protein